MEREHAHALGSFIGSKAHFETLPAREQKDRDARQAVWGLSAALTDVGGEEGTVRDAILAAIQAPLRLAVDALRAVPAGACGGASLETRAVFRLNVYFHIHAVYAQLVKIGALGPLSRGAPGVYRLSTIPKGGAPPEHESGWNRSAQQSAECLLDHVNNLISLRKAPGSRSFGMTDEEVKALVQAGDALTAALALLMIPADAVEDEREETPVSARRPRALRFG